jgi:hypothetical protein
MAWTFKGRLVGVEAAAKDLRRFTVAVQKKVLKKAITRGSQIVYKAARRVVPVDSKLLRKSLFYRVRVYRNSGVVMSFIGPRYGFSKDVLGRPRNPVRYAHIIHNGRKMVVPKKAGGWLKWPVVGGKFVHAKKSKAVAANPFLRRTFSGTKRQVEFAMIREIHLGIMAEQRRLAALRRKVA